jgi:RNA-directed DNA polymerase
MVRISKSDFKKYSFILYKIVLNLGFFMIHNLYQLYSELNTGKNFITTLTSNSDKFYYRKIKPKMKFGKYQLGENDSIRLRHLIPPVQKLKIIQQRICTQLQKIELPDSMYGSIEGYSNISNALLHVENTFFFKIDLKDFFSRISNNQVHHALIENGFSWQAARILTKLTTYKGSLPQGAPTSPVLANLAFARTARQLEILSKQYDITFSVFLDDLIFSSKKDFKFLTSKIINIIKQNGFFPHNKKIKYRKLFCEVTGLMVGSGKLKLITVMQKEALHNSRIKGYAMSVEKHYQSYLENKLPNKKVVSQTSACT